MEALKAELDALAPKCLTKGALHTAIGYALNNWPKFTAFLDHPGMLIDNSPMERAIRPFTRGRKNFLFAGSPRGADASALLYSLIESAKANGFEPYRYLYALFELGRMLTDQLRRFQLGLWAKLSSCSDHFFT